MDYAEQQKLQYLILGGGSNVLFTKDYNGIVLKNTLTGIEVVAEDEQHIFVKAAAGENWHQFVQYCIAHHYAGVENLSLIPGNVGASPMQNIGAYGVEIKDVFESLEAWHIGEKKLVQFTKTDCEFGYRESVFKRQYKNQFVITSVTFKLNKNPIFNTSYGAIQAELDKMGEQQLSIQAIAQAVINIRSAKLPDPKITGNAGSFFKNPTIPVQQLQQLQTAFPNLPHYPDVNHPDRVKIAAGWLIEQCGFKGARNGDAGCHPLQALVLVNYGNASGQQIFDFSTTIIEAVKLKFGITLEREVNIY
jgi:UDP-N-acetylmuramate dehydrogenase